MDRIQWPYASEGTLHGTVHQYDTEGNDLGAQDLTGYSLFFVVKDRPDPFGTLLFRKSNGTGLAAAAGTNGLFYVYISSDNVDRRPREYRYGMFIKSDGGTYADGTIAPRSDVKSVGSGIFEIVPGVKYGTLY